MFLWFSGGVFWKRGLRLFGTQAKSAHLACIFVGKRSQRLWGTRALRLLGTQGKTFEMQRAASLGKMRPVVGLAQKGHVEPYIPKFSIREPIFLRPADPQA